MGNGMNKVLPGLYLGNIRDAKDTVQLSENKITHILSIHDNSRPILMDKVYLCIPLSDSPTQNISQYFSPCNDFIHEARVKGGNVLVHCLAGVSRSVTIVVAYVMSVTDLGWRDSLNAVRAARNCASPNFGFQRQLLEFQHESLLQERERLRALHLPSPYPDTEECRRLIEINSKWVTTGDFSTANDASESNAKGQGEGDGVARSAVDASKSSLLGKNNENLQKFSRNSLNKVDNLTFSKLSGGSQSPTDYTQRFSCNGLREAVDDISENKETRLKQQDAEGLNGNRFKASGGDSASSGPVSDKVNLLDSGNQCDSLTQGKPK